MPAEEQDPSKTLTQLSSQLEAFKTALEPLLKTPLQDLTQDAEPLEKARLEVMTGYMVHDLIWMFLKTSGVDPATHPVNSELERLKGYFNKLRIAEGLPAEAGTPSTPSIAGSDPSRMRIDKDVAGRFINAAINSQKAKIDPSYSGAAVAGPSGTHKRFDEAEKAVDKLLEDESESEEEEGGDGKKKNGKEKDSSSESEESDEEEEVTVQSSKKDKSAQPQKRVKMDPFAGYDSPKPKSKAKADKSKSDGSQTSNGKHSRPSEGGDGLSKGQRKRLRLKQQKEPGGSQ